MCNGGGGGGGTTTTISTPPSPWLKGWGPGPGGKGVRGSGKITGRFARLRRGDEDVCSGNGAGGGHVPPVTSRGQAGRGFMRGSMGGARKNFDRAERVLGHAAADVLRGRSTVREWLAFELDLSRHDPGCRYARLVRAVAR